MREIVTLLFRLLHPSQIIHYCNQSVLVIVPDLNIYSFELLQSFISFREVPWYSSFLLRASYLYNSTGTKVTHIWFVNRLVSPWFPLSQVNALYCYYKNMVLRFMWYSLVFDHLIWKCISIYPALTHSDKQQHHFLCDRHCHGWVYYIDTTKIRF